MGGSRLSIPSSCVIPSIAADQGKVYVLTSSSFAMYSHSGEELFSWNSTDLEYQGFFESYFLEQRGSKARGIPSYQESSLFQNQNLGRMGGQIALNNSGIATEVYFTSNQGHLY